MKVKAAVVGATGYVGSELLRLLQAHPLAEPAALTSQSYIGKPYGEVFENFRHMQALLCEEENIEELTECCDVIFMALPHGVTGQKISKGILRKAKVIDMGADFRLKAPSLYEAWYKTPLNWSELLPEAVYGLSELNRKDVKNASLIANPGCYPTCSLLALYPLLKEGMIEATGIVIDAKSGVSGAGRGLSLNTHFCETDESIKAYGVGSHRHTPEIEQLLSVAAEKPVRVSFTPHLVPMNRGMLAVCYGRLRQETDYEAVKKVYETYYGHEPFIRLCKKGVFPETRWTKGSNYCDIGFSIDSRTGTVVIISAIDNLLKGAAGQAVQNMNIMFGMPETAGLEALPLFPC